MTFETNMGDRIDGNKSLSNDAEDPFCCNICLDPVKNREPIVTQCGHLYCWPCIFRWLNTNHSTCPVCKAGVTQGELNNYYILFYTTSTIIIITIMFLLKRKRCPYLYPWRQPAKYK